MCGFSYAGRAGYYDVWLGAHVELARVRVFCEEGKVLKIEGNFILTVQMATSDTARGRR